MKRKRIWLRFHHSASTRGRHLVTTYWSDGRESITEVPSLEACEGLIAHTVLMSAIGEVQTKACPDCGRPMSWTDGIYKCYHCGYSECG